MVKCYQQLTEVARFEKYGFEGVHVSLQAVLTLYAQVNFCLVESLGSTVHQLVLRYM